MEASRAGGLLRSSEARSRLDGRGGRPGGELGGVGGLLAAAPGLLRVQSEPAAVWWLPFCAEMAEELRIGLGDAAGARSPYWKLLVRRNDVYLWHEIHGDDGMKVSLHESGRCKLESPTGENEKWMRPPPQNPGRTHMLTLGIFPGKRVITTTPKPPSSLWPPAPPGQVRYFSFVFEDSDAALDSWPGMRAQSTELVGRMTLQRAERICVVTHVEPFEIPAAPLPADLDPVLWPPYEAGHDLIAYWHGGNADGSRFIIEAQIELSHGPFDG